jgi:pyruvate,water dikinase
VGTKDATKRIKNGQMITIDCAQGAEGFVYEGAIPFEIKEIDYAKLPKAPIDLMVNIANPDNAFTVSQLPVAGVGLARIEFIITNEIKIHPMALLHPESIKNKKVKQHIEDLAAAYPSKQQFFVDTLSQGIGMIAAAFYPRPVIVRLSDFKTNEYRNLIGGDQFEMEEANPMLGFRGASRYAHELYKDAFCLEVATLQKVREGMGFDNVMVMLPFVRTVDEAKRVVDLLDHCGLRRHQGGLKFVMMCEIPSNVIMMDEFAHYFDGFSIGSNDLTQLTLGVDRDSAALADLFDERDPAVKKMMVMAIEGAHRNKRFIGICGQAPSDYPELAEFLIKKGIDSISLNSDSVLPFLLRYKRRN